MTAELIEAIYDDPLACCDYEEKEVVKRLLILSKICENIGINYLEIVKRRSPYEQERVRKITEKVATKILRKKRQ